MSGFIIFMSFVGVLAFFISGALGAYIMGEKGKSTIFGFIFGGFFFLIGPILLFLFIKESDETLVEEMFERELITLDKKQDITQILEWKKEEVEKLKEK